MVERQDPSIQGLKSWLQDAVEQINKLESTLDKVQQEGSNQRGIDTARELLASLRTDCDAVTKQIDDVSEQTDPSSTRKGHIKRVKASINIRPLRNQIDIVDKAIRKSPLLQRYIAEQMAGFFWQVIYGLNGYLDALERASLEGPQYRVEKVGGGELPPQS